MPTDILPTHKPLISIDLLRTLIATFQLDTQQKYPLYLVGIRGYYRNTLGTPNENDRNIYDDAIIVLSPFAYVTFNANTDPSLYKKGIAVLKTGIYFAHKLDIHHSPNGNYYPAICQKLGNVTVTRDGDTPKEDTGYFGINIHKGGAITTSSLGCQTIYPTQWDAFYNLVKEQAIRLYDAQWDQHVIPYILIENKGEI